MNIILEAKRPEYDDWQVRSTLSELNYELHEGKVPADVVLDRMTAAKYNWEYHEPHTEFRLTRKA